MSHNSTARFLLACSLNQRTARQLTSMTQRVLGTTEYEHLCAGLHRTWLEPNEALVALRQRLISSVYCLKDQVVTLESRLEGLKATDDVQKSCMDEVRLTLQEARQIVNASQLQLKGILDAIDERHQQMIEQYASTTQSLTQRLVDQIRAMGQQAKLGTLSDADEHVLFGGYYGDTEAGLVELCADKGISEKDLPYPWSKARRDIDAFLRNKTYIALKASTLSHTDVKPAMKALKKEVQQCCEAIKDLRKALEDISHGIANDKTYRQYVGYVKGIRVGLTQADHALTGIPEADHAAQTAPEQTPKQKGHPHFGFNKTTLESPEQASKAGKEGPVRADALVGSSS